MLAWTTNPDSLGGLQLRDVDDPTPLPNELVVQVQAFAPNPGDLAAIASAHPGSIPGWDGSGIVVQPAADGEGPGIGEHVVFLGLAAQGWAQQRAVPHAMTAPAPTDVPWAELATLPVPATSALRAVRRFGSLLGRRLLIVGATSAVGRFAVQFAARSGAIVVAIARDQSQHAALRSLGAQETHVSLASVTPGVYGAIDMIGGRHLVEAYALLGPGATVIALGHAAGEDEHFPYGSFVADTTTSDRAITSFFLGSEPELAKEMTLLAADRQLQFDELDVKPWTELASWISEGAPRRSGRTVFLVDQDQSA